MIPAIAISADVVQHFVHEDQAWTVLGKDLFNHVAFRLDEVPVMFRDISERLFAAQLVRDLTPWGSAMGCTIAAATSCYRIKLGTDEHRHRAVVRYGLEASLFQNLGHTLPLVGFGAVLSKVIQKRQRMRFPAAELGCHVKNRRCLGLFPG